MHKFHRGGLIFLTAFMALYAIFFISENQKIIKEIEYQEALAIRESSLIDLVFSNISLEAKAFSIFNITQKEKLYGKNDKEILPLASLMKVMSAIIALRDSEVTEVEISQDALSQHGDNSLYVNEKWNKEDLVKFMLIFSSNDAAYALAEQNPTFLEEMNVKAQKLGLINTSFANFSGLDIDTKTPGALGTAEEMNEMVAYAYNAYPEILNTTIHPEMIFVSNSGLTHTAINTNTFLPNIPNILFSKTGATNLAGGNLSVIVQAENGEIFAITILGSSQNGRFRDMEKLVELLNKVVSE